MRGIAALMTAGILATFAAGTAEAGTVAMVEEISTPAPSLQPMSPLSEHQMLLLQPGERLVLTYTASCIRETIVGGVVMIGARESIVSGGTVVRGKSECDGGKTVLTAEQAGTSAAMVFRQVNLKLGTP